MMRQRGRRDSRSEDEDDFLDEDEQEKLVEELAADVERQQQQMLYYFSILSWAAAVMVVLLVLLDEFHSRVQVMSASLRLGRWLHAAAAAALHLGAASWDDWRLMVAIAVNLLVASAVLWSARADGWADVVVLHQGMVVANFVVLAVGFLLRWDQLDSDRALQELDASKYRYKSL